MGSKYGQCALGYLYNVFHGGGNYLLDLPAAIVHLRLAAAQGYDVAQYRLGVMYRDGTGVARDHAEAMRLFKLAAAQGLVWAMVPVGFYYELGTRQVYNLPSDKDEAIRWYRRALAAGDGFAAVRLQRAAGVCPLSCAVACEGDVFLARLCALRMLDHSCKLGIARFISSAVARI